MQLDCETDGGTKMEAMQRMGFYFLEVRSFALTRINGRLSFVLGQWSIVQRDIGGKSARECSSRHSAVEEEILGALELYTLVDCGRDRTENTAHWRAAEAVTTRLRLLCDAWHLIFALASRSLQFTRDLIVSSILISIIAPQVHALSATLAIESLSDRNHAVHCSERHPRPQVLSNKR